MENIKIELSHEQLELITEALFLASLHLTDAAIKNPKIDEECCKMRRKIRTLNTELNFLSINNKK